MTQLTVPAQSPPPATLVLFCRRPQPGIGKQRLAGSLGLAATAELSWLLLGCALEDAAEWPGSVVIAPAEPADAAWAARLLDRPFEVLAQPEGNLGQRLQAVDRALRSTGHRRIFYIGSDAPVLGTGFYARARALLDAADAVLAPARDGGVTLLGGRQAWPDLADLPWSTPALAGALRERLRAGGLIVSELDGRYDVDVPADLVALRKDLAGDPRPARQALRRWLTPGLSIVIPVVHDEDALAGLLEHLRGMVPPPDEIIVVDGSASERCRQLCRTSGARYLHARPGRGHQLHAGALRASGRILWFLHADALPPPDGCALVAAAIVDRGACGGWLRFCFTGPPTWYKRLLAALINWRARIGVPYGDQGLFVERQRYEACGGFADQPLFEEVPLIRALRRRGRFIGLPARIGVSPRRWERDGWLRRSLANRGLALAYLLGVSPERLARHYRPVNTGSALSPGDEG